MRRNIDRLIQDLEEDNTGLDVITTNMKNLDFILKKIIFLKSHAINMIFKDSIVLIKEPIDERTKE